MSAHQKLRPSRLSGEAQKRFDAIVRANSRVNAAAILGISCTAIEKLVGGAPASASLVAKVEAALSPTPQHRNGET